MVISTRYEWRSGGKPRGPCLADLRGMRRRSCRTRGGRRGRGARAWPRRWPTRAPVARRPYATPAASPPRPPSAPPPRRRRLRPRPNPQIRTARAIAAPNGLGCVCSVPTSASPRHCSSAAAAAPLRGGGDFRVWVAPGSIWAALPHLHRQVKRGTSDEEERVGFLSRFGIEGFCLFQIFDQTHHELQNSDEIHRTFENKICFSVTASVVDYSR